MNLGLSELQIDDLKIKYPIIQGGMGVGISLSGLASAIANQGGIGIIATAGIGLLESDFKKNFNAANKRALVNEINKAREKTDGIIGVNVMMALTDNKELITLSANQGVDVIVLSAGIPYVDAEVFDKKSLKNKSIKFITVVSSGRVANIIFNSWINNYNRIPDAIIIEGPLAGGHLGFKPNQIFDEKYKLENILAETIPVIRKFEVQFNKKIPIFVAGGIYSGHDIKKFINLGADGVQMATRFVTTHECDASDLFKETYLNCKEEDIVIIDSPVGLPGRAIKNQFVEDVTIGLKKPFKCPWKCLHSCDYHDVSYCISIALINAQKGEFEHGFAFCGANAYKSNKITSVKEVFEDLIEEYNS